MCECYKKAESPFPPILAQLHRAERRRCEARRVFEECIRATIPSGRSEVKHATKVNSSKSTDTFRQGDVGVGPFKKP